MLSNVYNWQGGTMKVVCEEANYLGPAGVVLGVHAIVVAPIYISKYFIKAETIQVITSKVHVT